MKGLKRRPVMGERPDEIIASDLADECEAFLAGAYAAVCDELGTRVPVWAWLNEVAHADESHIRSVAEAPDDDPDIETRTRVVLARAVVGALHDRTLAALQRDVVVPLELRVAGTELTPRRLVELLGRALYL